MVVIPRRLGLDGYLTPKLAAFRTIPAHCSLPSLVCCQTLARHLVSRPSLQATQPTTPLVHDSRSNCIRNETMHLRHFNMLIRNARKSQTTVTHQKHLDQNMSTSAPAHALLARKLASTEPPEALDLGEVTRLIATCERAKMME